MLDLNFMAAGCDPVRGPRKLTVLARRALRRVQRPMLHHLTQILVDFARRLAVHDQRLEAASVRVDAVDARIDALTREHSADLQSTRAAIHDLANAAPAEPVVSVARLDEIDHRLDEIMSKLQALEALHWDHVALARRLAVIEDVLAAGVSAHDPDSAPAIPFPGLDDEPHYRAM